MPTSDATYQELAAAMCGRRVSSTRLFLFTLQVYLAPDDLGAPELEIWCEPSWHIRAATGVVTGSGAIRSPSDYGNPAEMARADATSAMVGKEAKVLIGKTLNSLTVDEATHALEAAFSDGIVICTFVDDPETSVQWVLHDPARDIAVRGTPRGLAEGSRTTDENVRRS